MERKRGPVREPRYLWCSDCRTVVRRLRPDEEKSPRFSDALVKGPYGRPHAVTVLRRSEVRDLAGNLTAADALDRLREHRQTAV